jgi:hypothetical protein
LGFPKKEIRTVARFKRLQCGRKPRPTPTTKTSF